MMKFSHPCSLLLLLAVVATAQQQDGKQGSQAADADMVKDFFVEHGFVVLQGIFKDKALLQQLETASKDLFTKLHQEMFENGKTKFPEFSRPFIEVDPKNGDNKVNHYNNQLAPPPEPETKPRRWVYAMEEGRERGYKEIVMRNPGRYEISLELNELPGGNPNLDSLVNDLKIAIPPLFQDPSITNITQHLHMHTSLVLAAPEAAEQKWHSDGEHVDLTKHLPCHCLNVFIPLVDVPRERGPTEFYPGSHKTTRMPSPMKIDKSKLIMPPFAPELKLGDAVIFDYRTLHRGRANLSRNQHRPLLILTFSQPWFHDVYNWPKRSIREE